MSECVGFSWQKRGLEEKVWEPLHYAMATMSISVFDSENIQSYFFVLTRGNICEMGVGEYVIRPDHLLFLLGRDEAQA